MELSPNSVLSILKLLKRKKFKETVILKKVVNVIERNFYHYTYADVVYVVKILTFLNHFDESFFYFLFEKFLPPMGSTLPTATLVSTWGDKPGGGFPTYKAIHTYDEERLSCGQPYWNAVRKEHLKKVDEQEKDPLLGPVNFFSQVPQRKGPIHELSHLPLHLYEQKVKMKIDSCNIIREEEQIGKDKHMREVSFSLQYLEMYLNLFVYMGTCGHRDYDMLLRLSQIIRLCLLAGGGPLPEQGSSDIAVTTSTGGSGHVTQQASRFHSNLRKRAEPQFVCFHDAIQKNKKEDNFFSRDGGSVVKLSRGAGYSPPQLKCHKKSNANIRPSNEETSDVSQGSSADNHVATPIGGGKKSCLRFSYKESEKINFENLKKKKKKQSALFGEDTNKDKKDMSDLKYLNVEMFRRAKLAQFSVDLKCGVQTGDRSCSESMGRVQRDSLLSKHFGDVHPAAIRLHNRRLFRRHLDELHPSERYTEKAPPKPRVGRGPKSGQDLRLIRYKEIRNLRNVCLRRYAQLFKGESHEEFHIVKTVHKTGEASEEDGTYSYEHPFDMISDGNLIHVDDSLFVDYTLCDNKKKVALRKHSHLVRKSNQMTRKEYAKEGATKEEQQWRENNPSGDLLKWLYRYKNCLNLFPNEKNSDIHLIDGDIKQLGECLQKWYQESGAKTASRTEQQTGKGKRKAPISLKQIALITNSCSNLYHFDKNLIDVLLSLVSDLFRSFYAVQILDEQKLFDSDSKELHTCPTSGRETYQCMYRFTKVWSFLTVCIQINRIVRNVLSLDHRHEAVTKLVHLFSSPYFLLNLNHLIYVVKKMDYLSKQMERPSLIKRFLLQYVDISLFTNIFFFFCKKVFILVTTSSADLVTEHLKPFHTFTYSMLTLHRDYTRQWVNHSEELSSTPFEGVSLRRNIEDTTFLQCINFYVMFVCATYPGWGEKIRDASPRLGREHCSHLGTSSGVTDEHSGKSGQTCEAIRVGCPHDTGQHSDMCAILALSLRYIKLLSCARDFPPARSGKREDPTRMHTSRQTCTNTHTKVRMNTHTKVCSNAHRQLLPALQFYYLLRRSVRKGNPTNINEETLPDFFPAFIIKWLNQEGVKEVPIHELFPVGHLQHRRPEGTPPVDTSTPSSHVDTTLYYYFFNFFFLRS
ncbi:hypothetical protein PCYB_093740, partial [Plasmodium cynomolgi strain B]